jgi:hypothetical protein
MTSLGFRPRAWPEPNVLPSAASWRYAAVVPDHVRALHDPPRSAEVAPGPPSAGLPREHPVGRPFDPGETRSGDVSMPDRAGHADRPCARLHPAPAAATGRGRDRPNSLPSRSEGEPTCRVGEDGPHVRERCPSVVTVAPGRQVRCVMPCGHGPGEGIHQGLVQVTLADGGQCAAELVWSTSPSGRNEEDLRRAE